MRSVWLGVERLVALRFWVALMVTSLSAAVSVGLGLSPAPQAVGLVFFSALGIYNLDHLVDREKGLGRWPWRLTLGSLLAIVALLAMARPALRWLVVGGLLAISLYFVPFPWRGRSVRLENLPGFKPLLVGSAVAIGSIAVPWLSTRAHGREAAYPPVVALGLAVVLAELCACNALLFDIGDSELDKAAGVPTAPSVRGVTFTRKLASFGLAAAAVQSLVSVLCGSGPSALYGGTTLAALWLLGAAWLLPERTPRAVLALIVDGALALPWLFLLVFGAVRGS
ncbi:MAG TPA: hypothetical protein VLC09_18815 [Polyangiaceae bacterium]|nr:hypothetical protein [Polyangiaceae bacterium]